MMKRYDYMWKDGKAEGGFYAVDEVEAELAKKDEEIARLNGELEDYKEGTEGLKMAVGDLRDERDKYQEEMARLKNENEQLRKMPYETDINLPRMPKKTTSINVNVGPEKEKEEIARLRKALGFYGDEENYDMREICWAPGHMCVRKEIESDRGSVARETLEH